MKMDIIARTVILAVMLNGFAFTSFSMAAPPAVQSEKALPPLKAIKQPATTSPKLVLQAPLLVSETTMPTMSLYDRLMAAIKRVHEAYSPLRFTDCPSGWNGLEEIYYTGYNAYIKKCANKSYSVQDQIAAGCKGSDTVDQCTDKLFRACLSRYEQDKTNYSNPSHADLKGRMAKGIEKADKINAETKELSDALKTLKSLMP